MNYNYSIKLAAHTAKRPTIFLILFTSKEKYYKERHCTEDV